MLLPMMVAAMIMSGVLRAAGGAKGIMYAGLAGRLLFAVPAARLLISVFEAGAHLTVAMIAPGCRRSHGGSAGSAVPRLASSGDRGRSSILAGCAPSGRDAR